MEYMTILLPFGEVGIRKKWNYIVTVTAILSIFRKGRNTMYWTFLYRRVYILDAFRKGGNKMYWTFIVIFIFQTHLGKVGVYWNSIVTFTAIIGTFFAFLHLSYSNRIQERWECLGILSSLLHDRTPDCHSIF